MNKPVTRLSSKGQVVVPKVIRDRRNWKSGMKLTVEETPEGVLLKPERLFPPTSFDEAFGCLEDKIEGPPRSVEEMDEAVLEEARRRYARD